MTRAPGSFSHRRRADRPPRPSLPATFAKLLPLDTKLGPPQPGDWLDEHKEPGQSYWQSVLQSIEPVVLLQLLMPALPISSKSAGRSRRPPLAEKAEEDFRRLVEFVQLHPLVYGVGLLDRAGTEDDGGDA